MNRDEIHAAKYLKLLGYSDIQHEPDGKRPPDFIVSDDVAIEVTRLCKLDGSPGSGESLDKLRTPLLGGMVRVLEELGPPVEHSSWYVWYSYRRPLPPPGKLKRRVREWLEDFRDNVRADSAEAEVAKNLILRVYSGGSGPQAFILGGFSDLDSGGEVPTMMIESIRHVIDKKTKKITGVLANHREWWLLLVDWVGIGPSLGTQQRVKQAVKVTSPWSKVILVNGLNHADAFELDRA